MKAGCLARRLATLAVVLATLAVVLAASAVLLAALASPAAAQVADTTAADSTLQVPADPTVLPDGALQEPADASVLQVPPDSSLLSPDSTQAPPATATAASLDTLRGTPPVGFPDVFAGEALTDSIPGLLPVVDLVDILAAEPRSFAYLFQTPGWPDGWSFHGLPPTAATLSFNHLPFSQIFTGDAAYQLIPLALIQQPKLEQLGFGHPVAINTGLRPFVFSIPATEAKYWKGGDGFQSIEAVHAQHRRRAMFGNPGYLNVLGAYTGRAADGEYPGSRLSRGRQVLLRLRYEQPRWAVEFFNLHNRRGIGAHGGVIADPDDIESIYIRPGATVENSDAQRRIVRNDLAATARLRLLDAPSTATVFWTAETFRYTLTNDTLGTESDRLGLRLSQPLIDGPYNRLEISLSGWMDRISPRFDHPTIMRRTLHATARDTLSMGGWGAKLEGGIAAFSDGVHPVGSFEVSRRLGAVQLSAGLSASNRPWPAVAEIGFGSLEGSGSTGSERVLLGSFAMAGDGGAFDAEVGVFASRRVNPTDYFDQIGWPPLPASMDSVVVKTVSGSLDVLGAYADVGWRRDARAGLYVTLRPTLHFVQTPGDPPAQLIADTLPSISGRARLGARFVLFARDLDVDAYVEGVAWSAMKSRLLHPESGLLVVPPAGAPSIGPSSMINVAVEAGVRSATLFLVYENALSGTQIMIGNMLVPAYPLPERRFRFGVFWPMFG